MKIMGKENLKIRLTQLKYSNEKINQILNEIDSSGTFKDKKVIISIDKFMFDKFGKPFYSVSLR